MFVSLVSLSFCVLTAFGLRGGLSAPRPTGADWEGRVLAILAFGAACVLFGPLYGSAIVLSVMLHEFGHVAAYRVIGHDDARFRLLPLMGGVAISDRLPDTEEESFFVSLMGPGICLAPMVLAYALHGPVSGIDLRAGEFLWAFAITTGAMNFFNLLPLWPLDGGRCARNVVAAISPAAATQLSAIMAAALIAAAIAMQSVALVFFALMGAQSVLFAGGDFGQRRMSPRRALLALSAWIAVTATFAVGGWPVISWLFGFVG